MHGIATRMPPTLRAALTSSVIMSAGGAERKGALTHYYMSVHRPATGGAPNESWQCERAPCPPHHSTGDVICQKIQARNLAAQPPVDLHRTARFAIVGLLMHGPFFYHGYRWLDTFAHGPPSLKGVRP